MAPLGLVTIINAFELVEAYVEVGNREPLLEPEEEEELLLQSLESVIIIR